MTRMTDNQQARDGIHTEKHPLSPFLPEGARILMLGSFPPKRERWSMEFFYPNWINDMWRIFGFIFFGDKDHFVAGQAHPDSQGTDQATGGTPRSAKASAKPKRFDRDKCAAFAAEKGIAMFDTATEVRRLKDNASDKFLEIVTPTDIEALLREIPKCHAIVTTGQKATDVIVDTYGCEEPEVGSFTNVRIGSRDIRFWRMPSSSRAYPLPLENKAEPYRKMYETENIA